MRFPSFWISLVLSLALPSPAELTPDYLDWSNSLDDSADLTNPEAAILDIFNNPEPDPSLNLFSDLDSNGLTLDSNTILDDSFPLDVLTDAGVDNGDAATCLPFSFIDPLTTDELQTRSPIQCPNPLESPGSDATTTDPSANYNRANNNKYVPNIKFPQSYKKTRFRAVEPDPRLCPFERYGPRQLPICDSGWLEEIIPREDDIIDLKWARICMYGCYCSYMFG